MPGRSLGAASPDEPERSRTRLQQAAVGIVYLALATVFLERQLLGSATTPDAPSVGDLLGLYYPPMRWGFAQLRTGHLPAWDPYQSCGEALFANPLVGFAYPLYVVSMWILPTATALDVDLVVHLTLGAIGMFLLCRHFRMARLPAVVAGIVYAYHGSMMIKVNYPTFVAAAAWIPFVFLFVDEALERPVVGSGAKLGAVLALSLLGGYLQFTYFTGLALVPFVAVRAIQVWRRRGHRHMVRAGVVLGAAGALGLVAALVRLLPGMDFMRGSWRPLGSLTMQAASGSSIPPKAFLGLLLRHLAPAEGKAAFGEYVNETYVGMLPLALAGAGLVLWRRRGVALAVAAAGVAAVVYAFGPAGPLFPIVFGLPGGNWFRCPDRGLIVFGFAVAFLSAAGLQALGDDAADGRPPRARLVGALACIAGVAALALADGEPAGRRFGLLVGLASVVPLVVWSGLRSGRFAREGAGGLLAVVVLVELFAAQRHTGMRPSQLGTYLSRYDAFFEDVRARQGFDRTYVWGSFESGRPLRFFSVAQAGLMSGVWMAAGYNVSGRRIEEYLTALGPPILAPIGYVPFRLSRDNMPLADLMGIRFLLIEDGAESTYASREVTDSWRVIRRADGVVLYENPDALPRAFLVDRVEVAERDDAVLDRLHRVDVRDVAVVDEAIEMPPGGADAVDGARRATVADYTPTAVTVDVDTARPRLLVLTDQLAPGWTATVDGAPAPIHRADHLFRGVPVPAGRHRVAFRYRPPLVVEGALGSLAGWAAIVVLLVIPRWSSSAGREADARRSRAA